MYFFRLHCHDTYVYANLTMDVFGLRVLLAANDSTAQPGSTPGCSASVSKNTTRYPRHRNVEREVLTESESRSGCHSPVLCHVMLLLCSTIGKRDLSLHTGVPSTPNRVEHLRG